MTVPDTQARQGIALDLALALTCATLTVAIAVRLTWAAQARQRLQFAFGGLPPRLDTALSIFAANARLLGALIAAAMLVQTPRLRAAGRRPALGRLVVAACDTVLILTVALNVCLIGAALGGYGLRMVAAILPHAPFELAAFAPALALYLRARHQPQSPRVIAATTAAGVLALAAAAVLETYVAL